MYKSSVTEFIHIIQRLDSDLPTNVYLPFTTGIRLI